MLCQISYLFGQTVVLYVIAKLCCVKYALHYALTTIYSVNTSELYDQPPLHSLIFYLCSVYSSFT